MNIVTPEINQYLDSLLPQRHPKLAEMEELARERDFPIVGPQVGRILYQYIKLTGAKRIFELGSGFGYSAFWFALALPDDGKITCTEASQNNVDLAEDYLKIAGLLPKVELKTGDAIKFFEQAEGEFDIIFNDVDKEEYPRIIDLAADKLKTGGLLISDNTLFHGRVVSENPDVATKGILEYNEMAFIPELWMTTILPVRDGLAVSIKL